MIGGTDVYVPIWLVANTIKVAWNFHFKGLTAAELYQTMPLNLIDFGCQFVLLGQTYDF